MTPKNPQDRILEPHSGAQLKHHVPSAKVKTCRQATRRWWYHVLGGFWSLGGDRKYYRHSFAQWHKALDAFNHIHQAAALASVCTCNAARTRRAGAEPVPQYSQVRGVTAEWGHQPAPQPPTDKRLPENHAVMAVLGLRRGSQAGSNTQPQSSGVLRQARKVQEPCSTF